MIRYRQHSWTRSARPEDYNEPRSVFRRRLWLFVVVSVVRCVPSLTLRNAFCSACGERTGKRGTEAEKGELYDAVIA